MTDFDLLFRVSDLPPQIFGLLDPSSLALAACVCRAWRDLARKVRGKTKKRFRLVLVDLFSSASLLIWSVDNLNEKKLPLELHDRVCGLAAKNGKLAVIQWAHKKGYPWDELTCAEAAGGGHLAVLQWVHANGCPWDIWTLAFAAENGQLETLQWLRNHGRDWDWSDKRSFICAYAAAGGQLKTLQWLRKVGCEWDEQTCTAAAEHGHLEVLRWARANGCSWSIAECRFVVEKKGHKAVAAWIDAQPE